MSKVYYAPFDDSIMLPAEFLEAHAARAYALGQPPSVPPAAIAAALAAAPPALRDTAQRAAQQAAAAWSAMIAHKPQGLHDGQPFLPALESGLYEYLMLLGGRAGGKSHEVAEALVHLCSRVKKRVVCGREFQNSIRDSSHALLVNKIKAHRPYH